MCPRVLRLLWAPAAATGLVALLAAPAAAHVTVDPSEAAKGGFAKVSFRVPNERDDAGTTQVEVEFPADHPIPFVSVKPKPGWTANVERAPLPEPVEEEGEEITEAVSRITWTGGRVGPGEFDDFEVSMGPLPDDADELVFRALQTYENGEVVRWIEETPAGGEEPEFPAPVLTLTGEAGGHAEEGGEETTPAATEVAAEDEDEGESDALAVVALVVGAAGLVVGGAAFVLGRRRTT
jgi:periplasmic copper chaperone A